MVGTKLFQAGERGIIERLVRGLFASKDVTVPAGVDDAAALAHAGEQFVLTSDIMFESTHFPKGMPFEAMGRKIAIANLSDLAAMGARPLALLIALGLRPDMELDDLGRIFRGINSTCRKHGCSFVGGDMKRAGELTLSGAAVGVCGKGELLLRSNARVGDIVCVTGPLGDAYCGAQIMMGKAAVAKPLASRLIRAFLHPRARIKEARAIASAKVSAACMDISDGLFFTASEVARASGVGIRVFEKKLPFSPEARRFAHSLMHASPVRLLEWGEDYELLVCLRKKDMARVQARVLGAGGKLIPIGEVIKEKGIFLDDEPVDVHGYDAFA